MGAELGRSGLNFYMGEPSNSARHAVLAQHFLFKGLAPLELDRILALAVERRYNDGQIIFQKGDEGSSLMAVLAGRVRISVSSEEGKEVVLNVIEPGSTFGELALIDGKRRSADAIAAGSTLLLVIGRREFMGLLQRVPQISIQMLIDLCRRLRLTSDIAESVALLPIPVRLARLLMHLADNYGSVVKEGIRIDIRLSQQELGSFIAATRESVNKHLRDLQAQGIIAQGGGHITVLNLQTLEDLTQSLL